MVGLITKCRLVIEVEELDKNDAKSTLETALINQCNEATKQFFISISGIYKLNADTGNNENINCHLSAETKLWDVIKNGVEVASGGAAAGAAIGAAIGAIIGFFGGAGGGALPVAAIGAQIGSAIGGVIGGSGGAIYAMDGVHKGYVSEEFLQSIADRAVGITFAMASHGFGLGANLRNEDINSMIKHTQKIRVKSFSNVSLLTAPNDKLKEIFSGTLKELHETSF